MSKHSIAYTSRYYSQIAVSPNYHVVFCSISALENINWKCLNEKWESFQLTYQNRKLFLIVESETILNSFFFYKNKPQGVKSMIIAFFFLFFFLYQFMWFRLLSIMIQTFDLSCKAIHVSLILYLAVYVCMIIINL